MSLRTLIVDDEPLARERLHKLLKAEPDIEILGECANGWEALAAIEKQKPDLVFLDVQMPEMDGLEVLAELGDGPLPAVIFCTAYDRFALKAFELHALDYLLKPFDLRRFQKALQRAREQIKLKHTGDLSQRLSSLLAELKSEPKHQDRLAIKTGDRVLLLRVDEIDWIEAADNYVELHVGTESHLLRETLTALEARLAPDKFLRINRSTIVNLERIKELQPLFHGEYAVLLRNGTRLTLSRSHRDKLKHLLGKES